ncbi:phosphoinositide phosphatase SAC3-like isoform X2 [Arachis duranensis]|uniref:Phosphoinositide phosphatase SAC3-like isoform X2 n=1 Tax=Arachis duranensis TaxID=130453 RepID=A0A9C6TMR8_ARADU|nr:phosphoinositide phosphatase SAC3-like isoform X2 [Arachis duranensis]
MFSIQRNLNDHNTTGQSLYETRFVWNEFLTRGVRNNLQNASWTGALVYGFFKQVSHLEKRVLRNKMSELGIVNVFIQWTSKRRA